MSFCLMFFMDFWPMFAFIITMNHQQMVGVGVLVVWIPLEPGNADPVRFGPDRSGGPAFFGWIGSVRFLARLTGPNRTDTLVKKYEFFQQFSGYFRSKLKIYFLKLSPIAHSEFFHHAGISYMNLTFNLPVDLTQSPRNPSSALQLNVYLTHYHCIW